MMKKSFKSATCFNICFSVLTALIICLSYQQQSSAAPVNDIERIAQEHIKNSMSKGQKGEMKKNIQQVHQANQDLAKQNDALQRRVDEIKKQKEEDVLIDQFVNQTDDDHFDYVQLASLDSQSSSGVMASSARLENDSKYVQLVSLNSTQSGQAREDRMMLASANNAQNNSVEDVKSHESKTLDLLATIDAFAEEDERLRMDAAKAHYNMGNIYFQKGEYEIAAREYYQAVTLMPNDPDVHYNLAYVSHEFLRDYQTSLKHFKMYLYLNPNARDHKLVKEKIIEAEIHLRSIVDSPIESKIK
ncbi:MAG: tetratricopeptide repeat protein [Candidatus Omnitrophica bacterium]|nr:tetratricopeptide repeat protein [Candidatus Omnitrophota bacterium]